MIYIYLGCIYIFRLFIWRILEVRTRNEEELKMLKKIGIVTVCYYIHIFMWTLIHAFQSANMAPWSGILLMVAFSSFATAVTISSRPLTSNLFFPAISLFMLLQFPLEMVRFWSTNAPYSLSLNFPQFSQVIFIEAIVSLQRLSSFLNADDLQLYRTWNLHRCSLVTRWFFFLSLGSVQFLSHLL